MTEAIPFNRPFTAPKVRQYLDQVLEASQHSGNGPFSLRCCEVLKQLTGAGAVFLTPSCTAALEMSGLLMGIRPGDEVIVPSFTFVSTANAFALLGARPRFADVCPDTLNIDVESLESLIGPQTRAIVPVHYAGVACPMEPILSLAEKHQLAVVEDNAHGLLGSFQGRPLGSWGQLATLSFHETKNFSCGEGGALLVNRPDWIERAQILQDKGTNRRLFRQGLVDKYTWVDVGSSYLLGEFPAAVLLANLEARESSQQRRLAIWNRYHDELKDWCQKHDVRQPTVPPGCEHPAHLYYLLLPDLRRRDALLAHLKSRGILAVFHYQPLHCCPAGLQLGGRPGQCPVSERVAEQMVRLPLFADLTEAALTRIIEEILDYSL